MAEPSYAWFLLGVEKETKVLEVINFAISDNVPELLTEHESRALQILKARSTGDFTHWRLHACRLILSDHDDPIETKRTRNELLRFLRKCGFSPEEREERIEALVASVENLYKQNSGDRNELH